MAAEPTSQKITAEMITKEVVTKYPQTIKVFFHHGMQCTGCYICGFHSVAESAKQWGVELESRLNDLNGAIDLKIPLGFQKPEGAFGLGQLLRDLDQLMRLQEGHLASFGLNQPLFPELAHGADGRLHGSAGHLGDVLPSERQLNDDAILVRCPCGRRQFQKDSGNAPFDPLDGHALDHVLSLP
jgi:hybrid cluster-associated redox disulfide protein